MANLWEPVLECQVSLYCSWKYLQYADAKTGVNLTYDYVVVGGQYNLLTA